MSTRESRAGLLIGIRIEDSPAPKRPLGTLESKGSFPSQREPGNDGAEMRTDRAEIAGARIFSLK